MTNPTSPSELLPAQAQPPLVKKHWYQRSEMQETEDRASIPELFGHAGAPGRPDPGRKSFTFSACSSSFHSSRQEVVSGLEAVFLHTFKIRALNFLKYSSESRKRSVQ
jgi:hypothetical protein